MVKMKKSGLGLVIPKTLRIGGVTFYQRGGQVIFTCNLSNTYDKNC